MTRQNIKDYKKDAEGLKKDVARIILNNVEGDPEAFFNDLFSHGCVSGMVGELVYYSDTNKFAKKHIEEILALKSELEKDTGSPIVDKDGGDELNFLAWFAFEETARTIYQELGGEN